MSPIEYIALGVVLLGFLFFGARKIGGPFAKTQALVSPSKDQTTHQIIDLREYIHENIVEIARHQFPDNPDETWEILDYIGDENCIFVELQPASSDVGYDKFVFCISRDTKKAPEVLATYSYENGGYSLLCSSTNSMSIPIPKTTPFD